MDVIVDSSLWIEVLGGATIRRIESAMARGTLVLSPIVIAELLSGDLRPEQRAVVGELLQDFDLHETDLAHWMRVGELRRRMGRRGINVTIPDAHVAQCAIDRDATLLTRDEIFTRIAKHTPLRLESAA